MSASAFTLVPLGVGDAWSERWYSTGTHAPYERLAALPAPLRAKMRLVDYPDFFDLEASAIEPLVQGRLCGVGS